MNSRENVFTKHDDKDCFRKYNLKDKNAESYTWIQHGVIQNKFFIILVTVDIFR